MSQIEKNKAKLFEMIEELAHGPLSVESIRNLSTLYDAHQALCLVSREEHEQGHTESVRPR